MTRARGAISHATRSLHLALHRLSDPMEIGRREAIMTRASIVLAVVLAMSSLVSGTAYITGRAPAYLPLISALVSLLLFLTPSLLRSLKSSMIEREAPVMLAYILPYAAIKPSMADALLSILNTRSFKWVKLEVERLKLLLDFGMDPSKALSYLAETTPSRTLSTTIREYITAERLGVSKSQLTLSLVDSAMKSVRSQWNSYVKTVQALSEISLTLTATMLILSPLSLMIAPGAALLAASAPVFLAPLFTLLFIALRPSIGGSSHKALPFIVSYSAPIALSVLTVAIGPWQALAFGLALCIIVESINIYMANRESKALRSLREATLKSRVGLEFRDDLLDAKPVAGPLVDSILDASSIAGRTGISRALEYVYTTVAESITLAAATRPIALLLGVASIVTPAVSILLLELVSTAPAAVGLETVSGAKSLLSTTILASSPMLPLPAAALHRPSRPSTLYSVASLALTASTLEHGALLVSNLLGV